MKVLYQTNEFQTPITDELLEAYPKEVRDEFFDVINNVEFIKRLISPNRLRAKDLPRDESGKIIVDVMNPHILEDMDYFRQTGLYFQKYGRFTGLRPNGNPNSEYMKWLRMETHRCWYGMVRPEDGEWVTGEMYFYLNFMPMELTEKIEGQAKAVNRKTSTPRPWEGSYLWFHYIHQARYGGLYDWEGGHDALQIATRGAGKSFSCASMLARLFILGDNEHYNKKVNSFIMASNKDTLSNKDGTLKKFEACIDVCAEHMQWPASRLYSSLDKMVWEMGYIDPETGVKKGTRNGTYGITTNDDAEKGRGSRGAKIIYEEMGRFPKFQTVWTVNEPSVRDGKDVWGQMIGIGTGGSEGSNFYGILQMIYNPKGYNVYALPNLYDKNTNGEGKTIFFFGAYLNRGGYYNKDGVSDVVATILDILKERYDVKYNSTDPNRLTQVVAERPLTIQEAIMRKESSMFPAAQLSDRKNEIDANPHIFDDVYTGRMTVKNGIPEFVPSDVNIIREFPHKDNRLDGGIEIYQLPKKNKDGVVPANRYIAGTDPVDDDAAKESLSLQSTFILDLWTDEIVAEYTGRPTFADDYYEQLRLLLIYYNAKDNYENNKKGLFAYFNRMNSLSLLSDTIGYLKDKEVVKMPSVGNQSKGFAANKFINAYARLLYRSWLLAPVTLVKEIDGQATEITTTRLHTLKARALIQESIQWESMGNYDRISAIGALMLLREYMVIQYQNDFSEERTERVQKSYLGNDKYFEKNYEKRLQKMHRSYNQ